MNTPEKQVYDILRKEFRSVEQEQYNQEQPTQAPFPRTNFNVTPQGMVITTMLTPDVHIVKLVEPSAMDQITHLWREARKQNQQELQLIQDIQAGRGRENLQLLKGPKR
jgi:hypothetical protein